MSELDTTTKFYHYSQNNSGGSFIYDYNKGIAHHVIIEADSAREADFRAKGIGIYFGGIAAGYDCDCCGDRWTEKYYSWNDHGDDTPQAYGTPASMVNHDGWREEMVYEGFIHFKNGRKVGFAHVDGPGLEVIDQPAPKAIMTTKKELLP